MSQDYMWFQNIACWDHFYLMIINLLTRSCTLIIIIIEFDKFNIMKSKIYPPDCIIRKNNQQLVIIITNNKYIFLANNKVCKIWTQKKNVFLEPKE